MRRFQAEGRIEVAHPIAPQFLRQRKNQIEGDVPEPCVPQRLHGPLRLRGVVGAVHPFQNIVIERLGAQAHAVDAGGTPGVGRVDRDVFGVGFEGDLDCGLRTAD